MNIILFDKNRENYYPLSFTRPIADFRIGIFTIKEKWEQYYDAVSIRTEEYLSNKFPIKVKEDNLWVDARFLPSPSLVTELNSLRFGEALISNGKIIAFRTNTFNSEGLNLVDSNASYVFIENISEIFLRNEKEINSDFAFLNDRKSINLDKDKMNVLVGDEIFIEEGAQVTCSILNSENGPIYIGKDAQIMEGSIIKGPFAMLNNSVLKIGAKIYGGTTIGPYCKVGGEINNVVFFGYSSKAHGGFLGNSVIGEWCNLGADTNSSNLKNNYTDVKIWNYLKEGFKDTGLQFCGLIMGDHSKCAINTMFNTGTVVGVSSNIFGSGFPRQFIPSFSWGGASGFSVYRLTKVFEVVEKVFARRDRKFDKLEKDILEHVYGMTKRYRNE